MKTLSIGRLWIAALIISLNHCPAQTPVWSQFASSPSGTSPRNDDIHFVDITNGWVARATDGIYRTTNGGITFEKVRASNFPFPGTNLNAHFRSIGFASTTRGWAGNLAPGSYDGSVTDTNMLYETFDGGTTWTPVEQVNASGMKGYCAIHVLDSQHVYGVGRVRGPAYFSKSEDGGTNWYVTNLTAAGVMGGLMDVYFKDATNGFIVGMDTNAYSTPCTPPYYHGAIARTTNAGLSWEVVANTTINCSYFWKMSWPSANVGYASLQQNATESTIVFYKTTDGGATWTSNGIPHTAIGVSAAQSWFVQSIGFVSETEGWMGGSVNTGLTFNQCFIRTTNGGLNWETVGYDSTRGMNRIRFNNSGFGYGSGQKLHVFRVPLGIAAPPTNLTVNIGSPATFYSTAYGTAPLTYQWRFNSNNISGANSVSYTIASAQLVNTGSYDVVVGDYSGSLTSSVATLTVTQPPVAPSITVQPQSLTVNAGDDAAFSVTANGTAPLAYQWRFAGTNILAATNTAYTRTNAQVSDAGSYTVVVTNSAGSITSSVATLTVNPPVILYQNNFDAFTSPVTNTSPATANGFKIFFNAASGPADFTAIFGFDYSTVTFPTNIVSAPNSTNSTTKGLYLTVNKDGTAAIAAVNLYPTNQTFGSNYALKFDLWLNWANGSTSTEHALFGINHSASITNRVTLLTSDGLFFAVDADGGASATSAALRDFSVFRGGGAGVAPILMITNNTTFGPTPPLGNRFDGSDNGFSALFPSKTIAGWTTTAPGVAGVGWVQVEVRQIGQLITCLLNGTAIAQYTNTTTYTNGNILIGYNDHFSSIGDANSFAIFDNIRVENITIAPAQILSPQIAGANFSLSFGTVAYDPYSVQWTTNLASPVWATYTNLVGNGLTNTILIPLNNRPQQYFRVSRP